MTELKTIIRMLKAGGDVKRLPGVTFVEATPPQQPLDGYTYGNGQFIAADKLYRLARNNAT